MAEVGRKIKYAPNLKHYQFGLDPGTIIKASQSRPRSGVDFFITVVTHKKIQRLAYNPAKRR